MTNATTNTAQKKEPVPIPWVVEGSLLIAAIFFVLDCYLGFYFNVLLLKTIRKDVYMACAGSIASILGFIMASAAILLTVDVERHFANFGQAGVLTSLFGVFIKTINVLIVCFCLSFVCLFVDRENTPLYWLSDLLLASCFVGIGLIAQSMNILQVLGHQQLFRVQEDLRSAEVAKEAAAKKEAEEVEKWQSIKSTPSAEQKAKGREVWLKNLQDQDEAEEKLKAEELAKIKKTEPPAP